MAELRSRGKPEGNDEIQDSARQRLALAMLRGTAELSRRLGRGSGSTIGGRVGLAVAPDLLEALASGRRVALISGTNGKTTTTRLCAVALRLIGEVASSTAGANMAAGQVTALAEAKEAPFAVLEVDEAHLPSVATAVRPEVIALLNLSRDQLDRTSEVRMLAERWRLSLPELDCRVIANVDDPLVVFAASTSKDVLFIAAGGAWHEDAYHCPVCDARIEFGTDPDGKGWSCSCGFDRPEPDYTLDGDDLVDKIGRRVAIELQLPGRFNAANAAVAAVIALQFGVEIERGLAAMRGIEEVSGRFAPHRVNGRAGTLMLAKNPAGWSELIDLVAPGDAPVVIGINARIADGHDPSWLWDVPFERLSGHLVAATGDRRHDLALRLAHAGVEHLTVEDPVVALEQLVGERVDYIGNYTAFQEMRSSLRHGAAGHAGALAPPLQARPIVDRSPSAADRSKAGASKLRVVIVHPDLLGTYGDAGNGVILANRAAWRGIPVELVLAPSDLPLPTDGDIYCLGGGEDGPQVRATERLRDGTLQRAVERGAVVLAICAGYQILGEHFPGAHGALTSGLGLLDVRTARGERRSVGEVLSQTADGRSLTGFENHAGKTTRGSGVAPFATVKVGVGNGDRTDGARVGSILGTYLHGPVLARNAWLADELLSLALGHELVPLADEEEHVLAQERLAAIGSVTGPLAEMRRRLLRRGVRALVSR